MKINDLRNFIGFSFITWLTPSVIIFIHLSSLFYPYVFLEVLDGFKDAY